VSRCGGIRVSSTRRPNSARFKIGRFGLHWPEIDEDLEFAGLLLGAKTPGATRRSTREGRKLAFAE